MFRDTKSTILNLKSELRWYLSESLGLSGFW